MAAGLKDAAGLGFMVMVLQVLMTAISIPLMEPWRDAKRCVQGDMISFVHIVYRQHACTASKHTLTTLANLLHVYICSSSLRNYTSMLRTHGMDYHICIYQDDVVFTGFCILFDTVYISVL